MIIVDRALQARAQAGHPIRVGMIGAGFLGRGIAAQIINRVPGMELVAVANRHPERARDLYADAGVEDVRFVESVAALNDAVDRGQYAITDDASLLCTAGPIDALIEVTGAVEFGAQVALRALEHGKHILINAELDGTVGPMLKVYADRAGVVISALDGDQPGTQLNLHRFVRGLGMEPLLCGNIKGLQDHYRTPATQQGFAERWGLSPEMATSFADGTKISFEQTVVANATGMRVAQRGMLGYQFDGHIDEMTTMYDVDQLRAWGGIVDYALGAKPSPGVFVFATYTDPSQRHYLDLYKLGEGPLYSFYAPYHLCHFEAPSSVARAVLFSDAVTSPVGGQVVDVVATAKRDLRAGEVLDGIGYYMTYGQCENHDVARAENLLPMGLAEGCRLIRDVSKDHVLTYSDVALPEDRLCDQLRAEQNERFPIAGIVSPAQPVAVRS